MQLVGVLDYPVIILDDEQTSQMESISSFLVHWRWKFRTDQRQRRRLTIHPGPIVLPPEPDDRVVDLILHTAILGTLHLRFAVSSLRCVAFSLDGANWHEVLVNAGETPIIPWSTVVSSFTSGRASLNPSKCDVSKASLLRSVNLLGQYIQIHDANKLKRKGAEKFPQVDKSELERAFGVIVTIFCEGARFRCLEDSIAQNFEDFPSCKLGGWAIDWIHNWVRISCILQAVEHFNKTGRFPARYATSDEFIRDMETQIRDMGLTIPTIGSIEGVENVLYQLAVVKYHNIDY